MHDRLTRRAARPRLSSRHRLRTIFGSAVADGRLEPERTPAASACLPAVWCADCRRPLAGHRARCPRPLPRGPLWLGVASFQASARVRRRLAALTKPGSQTGSQQPQTPGHARPHPATVLAGGWHAGIRPAMSSDCISSSYKREVAGSIPAAPTRKARSAYRSRPVRAAPKDRLRHLTVALDLDR